MSSRACSYCGSNDIDYDPGRGDAVCTNCGSVLEDKIIVSEVQFQESSSGAASVIGQYVSNDGSKGGMSMGSGFRQVSDKDSRAVTLQKGKMKIRIVGEQLRLNQHCIDTAFNFFKMAVSKRLTRGRKTSHVVAACLYIVCRTEGTPHMLLDFSDLLQVNVYTLGRTYLTFSQELCINIPAIDPCLYIPRFAHKMEFGDKTHEVSMTALRLVQRMKRDWMHTGRRPSGLCGAALVVAARIHNFNRTLKDLIKIVRVCESTIRRRLTEFSDTPSSQLTIHEFEFQKIDLEQEQDPPCFTEGKRKAKLQHLEEPNKLSELTKEIDHIKEEIEKKLDAARPKCGPWAGYAKMNTDAPEKEISPVETETNVISTIEEEALAEITKDILTDNGSTVPAASEPHKPIHVISDIVKGPTPTAASLGIRECIEECLDENTIDSTKGTSVSATSEKIQRRMSLDVLSVIKPPMIEQKEEVDDELDLSGIDEEEIDKMLLTEEEIKLKTQVWMAANEEFLKEMQEKEEKRAKEIKPEKKRRECSRKNQPQPATANEAITRLLMEKKISSKINYGVLNDLKNKSEEESEVSKPPVKLEPVIKTEQSLLNRFKRHHDIMNESRPRERISKRVKVEKKESEPEIVVESGPVQYVNDEKEEVENVVEDEEEEDEYLSASQLLGHGVEYTEEEVYDIDDDD